jgi:hypothetical protein
MSILKRGADLVYAFRFVRLMATRWENWPAAKLGIIDNEGKKLKNAASPEEKASWTPFIRLAANIKRLLSKLPLGSTRIGGFATALWLMKEKYDIKDATFEKILKEHGVDLLDILKEDSEWFVLDDKQLSPGIYTVRHNKVCNRTFEEIVRQKDKIKIAENCYPVGDIFGIDIYEAVHMKTGQSIYITSGELLK